MTSPDVPMTEPQARFLRTLCEQAGEPFPAGLTKNEAWWRIKAMSNTTSPRRADVRMCGVPEVRSWPYGAVLEWRGATPEGSPPGTGPGGRGFESRRSPLVKGPPLRALRR
jgi:hypothetical protein